MGLIAHTGKQSTDSNGFASAAINTTGANLLVFAISSQDSSATPSDSKGNTWVAETARGSSPQIKQYHAVNPTVGSGHTFTVTSTGKFPGICVSAFDGRDTSTPFDKETGAAATPSPSDVQPGAMTPTNDGAVIVASYASVHPADDLTVNGGFTFTDSFPIVGGQSYGISMAYLIQTTKAASNPQFAWSGDGTGGVTQAAFNAATAAHSFIVPRRSPRIANRRRMI